MKIKEESATSSRLTFSPAGRRYQVFALLLTEGSRRRVEALVALQVEVEAGLIVTIPYVQKGCTSPHGTFLTSRTDDVLGV